MKEITRELCPVVNWVKLNDDDLTRKNEESKEGSRRNMAYVLSEMLAKAGLLSLLRFGVRQEIILSWVDQNEREGVLAIYRRDEILGQSQLKGKRVSSTHSSRSQSSVVGKFRT